MSKSAQEYWALASRRTADIHRTFNDIQTSGNPLTQEEIRKLAEKRPEIWGRFVKR